MSSTFKVELCYKSRKTNKVPRVQDPRDQKVILDKINEITNVSCNVMENNLIGLQMTIK